MHETGEHGVESRACNLFIVEIRKGFRSVFPRAMLEDGEMYSLEQKN